MDAVAPHYLVPWDGPGPEAAFARLAGQPGRFWLDSSRPAGGRYSILGCGPLASLRTRGREWEFAREGAAPERGTGDPAGEWERRLRMYQVEEYACPVPFRCGAVGFVSYDLGRPLEPAGFGDRRPAGPDDPPDMHWAWHDAAVVWDHREGAAWLLGAGWRRPAREAAERLGSLIEAGQTRPEGASRLDSGPRKPLPLDSNFTRESYVEAVRRVRERIAAGEIYQMNLAQRFEGPWAGPPDRLYSRLRRFNPAPMAAYLEAGEWTVLSSSPERFLEGKLGGGVRTFPIKGTRPRGPTPEEDARLRAELESSAKERAELLMIVDLLRNDLGRVCRFGSIRVPRLRFLESFSTVHHLVGEVEGELRPGVGPADLLRAAFPGGSITGAPKVSAMRLIDSLEPVRRGIFSGSIGYWSACGRFDLNIAIRTIVCRGGRAHFAVGSGIVWDSDPEAEYEETLAKGRALAAALGAGFPGETQRQ